MNIEEKEMIDKMLIKEALYDLIICTQEITHVVQMLNKGDDANEAIDIMMKILYDKCEFIDDWLEEGDYE